MVVGRRDPARRSRVGRCLVFVAVLAAAWVATRRVVDLAGGPRVEWRLLRERYQIWSDYADVSPTDAQATKAARARIRALDAFRGPSTSIYIDLFQALTLDASDAPRSTRGGRRCDGPVPTGRGGPVQVVGRATGLGARAPDAARHRRSGSLSGRRSARPGALTPSAPNGWSSGPRLPERLG